MNFLVMWNDFNIAHNLPVSHKSFFNFTDVFLKFDKSKKIGIFPVSEKMMTIGYTYTLYIYIK